jgi:glycosyltransferase involved in cell wall biosynthesis
MSRVHQFLECAVPRDAVTQTALVAFEYLSQVDPSTRIWANAFDWETMRGFVHTFGEYEKVAASDDVCLYHLSCDSPLSEWLRRRRERLAVMYHNITPGAFFRPFDPEVADRMEEGRRQAESLASRCSIAFAASHYSASELAEWGYPQVSVVGAHSELEVSDPEPDKAALDALVELRGRGPAILFVGRLTPNKAQHKLIEAVALVRRRFPDAKLWLVGAPHIASYALFLQDLASERGLGPVFAGSVSRPVLASYLRAADVFCSVSEHEGYGLPVVEAMRFGLPIVAYDSTAVGETVGSAGLLVDSNEPTVVAEAIVEVVENERLRENLIAAGKARLDELPNAADFGRELIKRLYSSSSSQEPSI